MVRRPLLFTAAALVTACTPTYGYYDNTAPTYTQAEPYPSFAPLPPAASGSPTPVPTPTAPAVTPPPPITREAFERDFHATFEVLKKPLEEGVLAATPPGAAKAAELEAGVLRELAMYPPSFAAISPVRIVVLCGTLTHTGREVAGVAWAGGARPRAFYLASASASTFHHEMFHQINIDEGGFKSDSDWTRFNPPGFEYLQSTRRIGAEERAARDAALEDPAANGFVSGYAGEALKEDKAEVFAALMADPRAIEALAATPAGQGKIARMKKIAKGFNREFDEAFWTKVAAIRRAEVRW